MYDIEEIAKSAKKEKPKYLRFFTSIILRERLQDRVPKLKVLDDSLQIGASYKEKNKKEGSYLVELRVNDRLDKEQISSLVMLTDESKRLGKFNAFITDLV